MKDSVKLGPAMQAGFKNNKEKGKIKNMKRTLIITALAAMAFLAGNSAQASLVAGWSGSATFVSAGSGNMTVNYFVDLSGGVYTYVYQFSSPTAPIGQYNVNVHVANVSTVLVSGNSTIGALATADLSAGFAANFTGANTFYFSESSANPALIEWTIQPAATGSFAFAFTSPYGPLNGSGTLQDGSSGPWSDNAGLGNPIPIPNPPATVPEASTIMAGALMLLPLGIGAVRSLRKERTA
jgi:hypothetical protein